MKTVVLLFSLVVVISAKHAELSKKYYVMKLTKLSWYGAFIDCLSRDLQLATINSAAEQIALEKVMTEENVVTNWLWISGTDLQEETNFVWMSTGKFVNFTKWSKGQPDNGANNEHCVHIYNPPGEFGAWNDLSCATKLFYICEEKPGLKVKLELSMDVDIANIETK